jgi:hypothetical protein
MTSTDIPLYACACVRCCAAGAATGVDQNDASTTGGSVIHSQDAPVPTALEIQWCNSSACGTAQPISSAITKVNMKLKSLLV